MNLPQKMESGLLDIDLNRIQGLTLLVSNAMQILLVKLICLQLVQMQHLDQVV